MFGSAVAISHLAQVGWLLAGSRLFAADVFGAVLASQALYGVQQIIVDNGTAYHGARLAAVGGLDDEMRGSLARLRVRLALFCAVGGLVPALLGGGTMLQLQLVYAPALLLFSLLTVWEPYGRGEMLPFATYLALRSLTVAVVVGVAYGLAIDLPPVSVAFCELLAILTCGVAFKAWRVPMRTGAASSELRRIVRDITVPALITQFCFAAPTVVLATSGRTAAAAVLGVAMRLVTGVQGVTGIIAAGAFPKMAAHAYGTDGHADENGRIPAAGIVVLALAALAFGIAAAPLIERGFFAATGSAPRLVLLLALSSTTATGLIMQWTFVLIAQHRQAAVPPVSAVGAAVVAAAAMAGAVLVAAEDAAIVTVVGFTAGQVLVVLLLAGVHRRAGTLGLLERTMTFAAVVGAPAAALAGDVSRPAGVLTAAAMLVGVLLALRRDRR